VVMVMVVKSQLLHPLRSAIRPSSPCPQFPWPILTLRSAGHAT
jgi:hypothetical protein